MKFLSSNISWFVVVVELDDIINNVLPGNITTRSRAVSESEIVVNSSKQMYGGAGASVSGTRTLQFPHYQSSSPVVGAYCTTGTSAFNAHCTPVNTSGCTTSG